MGARTRKTAPKKPVRAVPPALKVPRKGDESGLEDLRLQRDLLRTRLKSRKTTTRDLATVSAELRKVNTTISVVVGTQSKGGIDEEELAARANQVRAMLLKTKAERDRLLAEASDPQPVPKEGVGAKAAP